MVVVVFHILQALLELNLVASFGVAIIAVADPRQSITVAAVFDAVTPWQLAAAAVAPLQSSWPQQHVF